MYSKKTCEKLRTSQVILDSHRFSGQVWIKIFIHPALASQQDQISDVIQKNFESVESTKLFNLF
jgi:hypothetical protein